MTGPRRAPPSTGIHRRLQRVSLKPNVRALCGDNSGGVLVGHSRGLVQRLTRRSGRLRAERFQHTSEIPVVRIVTGPGKTVAAGYLDGTLAIWDSGSLKLLHRLRLNGPVVHLLRSGHTLHAATEQGQHRAVDLSALTLPRCDLLRQVWAQAPFAARDGVLAPRPLDADHSCRKRGRTGRSP